MDLQRKEGIPQYLAGTSNSYSKETAKSEVGAAAGDP